MFQLFTHVYADVFYQINQIFYYTRCITPKGETSLRGPISRHCARATQLFQRNVAAVVSRW